MFTDNSFAKFVTLALRGFALGSSVVLLWKNWTRTSSGAAILQPSQSVSFAFLLKSSRNYFNDEQRFVLQNSWKEGFPLFVFMTASTYPTIKTYYEESYCGADRFVCLS